MSPVLSPQFLNQVPPLAQQLRLPVFVSVPHEGHTVRGGAVGVVMVVLAVVVVIITVVDNFVPAIIHTRVLDR